MNDHAPDPTVTTIGCALFLVAVAASLAVGILTAAFIVSLV